MLVDYEKVVLAFKAYVADKKSHGQRDLLAELARLESAHQLEEGLPEKALRLYGVVFSDALLRPTLPGPRVVPGDGPNDQDERRSSSIPSEEDNDGTGSADPRAGHADARAVGAADQGASRAA